MCIVQMCVCMCVQGDTVSWGPSNAALDSILAIKVISIANPLSLMCWLIIFLVSVSVCDSECVHNPVVYVWAYTSVSGVCEGLHLCTCVSTCVCVPSLRLCFLVPTELTSFCNKARLRSSISFTLRWWESAAPLIVFGVLGQHTQISLRAGVCVCVSVCARVCASSICSRLKIGVKPVSPFLPLLLTSVSVSAHRRSWLPGAEPYVVNIQGIRAQPKPRTVWRCAQPGIFSPIQQLYTLFKSHRK